MKAIGLAFAALCASAVSMGAHAADCTGLPEWNSTDVYVGNTKVQEAGKAYTAAWWSQGHSPASYSGPWQEWKLDGTCENANHNPVAVITITTYSNTGYHSLGADASHSSDVDGDTLTFSWTLNGQPYAGNVTSVNFSRTVTGCSTAPVVDVLTLTAADGKGGSNSVSETIYTRSDYIPPSCYSSSATTTSSARPSSSSVATTTSSSSSSVSSAIANRAPVAKIMSTAVQLVAETVALGVSGSGSTDADGDPLSYSWNFGDQSSATGVSANHMYVAAGTYTVTLTVSDGRGGVGTATTQAIVAPKPNSSSSVGNGCTSPQFISGANYSAGQLVQNGGNEYKCDIAGWCSSTADWAYAPGTGSYWTSAWTLVRSCGVASSSSSSSVSSVSSTSASSTSSVIVDPGKRIISGYWHNFNNGSGVIPIDQVSNAYDYINVSFAEPTDSNGHIGFTLDPAFDKTAFKAGIKAKQAAGKKIIISIGGANGHVSLTSSAARANFVSSVEAIIDEYGFDGFDVDFEGQSLYLNAGDADFRNPTTPVIVNLIGALQDLTNHYGSKFILTMAPETFFVQLGYSFYGGTCSGCDTRAGAYLPVIYALRDKLTALQVQNYNSGSITGLDNQYHNMGVADFHVAMVDMLLTGFKVAGTNLTFPALRQDQVLLGLPANGNAGGGFTSVSEVQAAVNCLAKLQNCGAYKPHTSTGWTNFRGLMTWSINWDKFNNFEFSSNHRQFLDTL